MPASRSHCVFILAAAGGGHLAGRCTGYQQAVEDQVRHGGGLTGSDDPSVAFYNGVPSTVAEEALSKERSESDAAYNEPWPLDAMPAVPTRFVVCTEDRFLPAPFMRGVAAERLGVVPDENAAGHCVALSHPDALGDLFDGYTRTPAS